MSGNGTATLTVTPAGVAAFATAIRVTDSAANTGVDFADSGANGYADPSDVALDGGSAGVTFSGASAFGATGVSVRTDRDIVLNPGASLAAGDVTGDGSADLGFGATSGGRVLVLSGRDLVQTGSQVTVADFTPAGDGYANGVRVAVRDVDGDGRADLLAGSGPGSGSRVTAYRGPNLAPGVTPPTFLDFTAFTGFAGGVFEG